MNIVNETANKVRELEKRLDAEQSGGGLGVTEIKKEFDNLIVAYDVSVLLCHYKTVVSGSAVVFQGQFNFALKEDSDVVKAKLMLRFDGYIIHSELIEISKGKTSFQVIHTLPSATKNEKAVELVLSVEEGSCYLSNYDCFIWGYGITISGSYHTSGCVDACYHDQNYAFFLVNDKMGYFYNGALPTSINFSVSDFNYLSKALSLSGVFLPKTIINEEGSESKVWNLYCFKVAPGGYLSYHYGENLESESDVIATGVTHVNACLDKNKNEAVVVYASGKNIYYFNFDGENRSENILLYTFDENVEEVSIIENCSSTCYMVASLESGKNYLFSSVTTVSVATSKEGKVVMKADIHFN